MLVFDLTNRDTFENITKWMQQVKEKADPSIVMILIGNKSDLQEKRQVKHEEALNFSEKHCKFLILLILSVEMAYIETSALNASNVDKAFRNLVTEIYKISKS